MMISANDAMFLALFLPAGAVVLLGALREFPVVRDIVHVGTAVITFSLVVLLLIDFQNGEVAHLLLFEVMPGLPIYFALEPLGLVFALLASGLDRKSTRLNSSH